MVAAVSSEQVILPAAVDPAAKTNDARAPQTPTGRKRPCCTKCGKPMRGHKRAQCSTESTSVQIKKENGDEGAAGEFTAQLAEMRIVSVTPDFVDEKAVIEKKASKPDFRRRSAGGAPQRPKAQTLVSLTTTDKALLETLGKPGMMSKDVVINESESRANIEHWLDSVPASESPRRSRQKRQSGPPIESSRDFDGMLDLPLKDQGRTKKQSLAKSAKPLGRTSSAADREEFYERLVHQSKKPVASVFTVDMKDIQALEENAKRLRFHARVIAPKYADGSTGNGWLVVGKDESGVKELFSEVEKEVKGGGGYLSTLGKIATGAVIAWSCLAFS